LAARAGLKDVTFGIAMTLRGFSAAAVEGDGTSVRLVVRGELDLATTAEFQEALHVQQASGRHVVLDLAELDFIDSTGVRALLEAVMSAQADGWNLGVDPRLTHAVQRVFELTGLLPLLPLIEESPRTHATGPRSP
jgi:anti-anti-sigma factor